MADDKTVGQALSEAVASGDNEQIKEAMKAFWGAAKSVGLPTPETHPPEFLKDEKGGK
jgi:hypothetical protein